MAATIYLDQNALIYLYEESLRNKAFGERLAGAISAGQFKVVLSPWHWVETAQTQNTEKALALAEFMDHLRPGWLRDRRHLSTTEVEHKFFQFAGVSYKPLEAIVTRAELLTEMNGFPVTPEGTPSSPEFVDAWTKDPRLMAPMLDSHEKQKRALVGLREALSLGNLTPDMMRAGDREHIERQLPRTMPNGVVLDAGTKNSFLDRVTQQDFPTLAIESEIAEHSWAGQGRVDWNSMIDKFHVISSMHYVDVVVSDDRYFYLLLPSAQRTGYAKATVMRFKEFCARFLA